VAKYAIFSDLHLGDGGRHDLFGRKDYAVMREWMKLLAKGYTILLNGDIFEFWKCSEFRVRRAHPVLYDLIRKTPEIILLVGNHDYDLMGNFTYFFSLADGRRVLVSHGFQNDRWMVSPFMRAFVLFAGWLERFLGIRLEKVFSHIYSEKFDKNVEKNTYEYAQRMFQKFDIVICGHTHIQERLDKNGKTYLNSGHGLGRRLQYIKIHTRKNKIQLVNKKLKMPKPASADGAMRRGAPPVG